MASAFIIEVNSQLRPDPTEETAALLRVLIYKTDNTTFGDDIPTVPQWSGPPHVIVQVQAILYASLAASLFSAFLAMLGKQWLNRYASINVRGSVIERSQNRQQKLNGIVTWYFDYVMESLPLMLQVALLLFGCALSRYLWGVNTAIASVTLGATSFGIILYLSIVVAGATFVTCPYQTPGSRVLRSVALTASAISSAFGRAFKHSETVEMFQLNAEMYQPLWSRNNIGSFLRSVIYESPPALAVDSRHLGRAVVRSLVASARRAYALLLGVSLTSAQGSDQQTALLDLHCISWMLRTSLDKEDRLSTMEYLATIVLPAGFDPTLVVDCFNVLVGCVGAINGQVVTTQRSKKLETMSAAGLLYTLSHFSAGSPMPTVVANVRQRYRRAFPPDADYKGYPLYHTLGAIRSALYPDEDHGWLDWGDHKPTAHEHVVVARALSRLAQSEYKRRESQKTPRWVLRFAFHSLSQDPPPPTSVVFNCLSVIATDLDCDVSSSGTTRLDERYVHTRQASTSLTRNQCTAGGGFKLDSSETQSHSRHRRLEKNLVQAQSYHRVTPVRNLARARWTIQHARSVPKCC